jgi:hypothetical protein
MSNYAKIKIKLKSMILEDDINKVKWMTLKFMERKMLYFILLPMKIMY